MAFWNCEAWGCRECALVAYGFVSPALAPVGLFATGVVALTQCIWEKCHPKDLKNPNDPKNFFCGGITDLEGGVGEQHEVTREIGCKVYRRALGFFAFSFIPVVGPLLGDRFCLGWAKSQWDGAP